jgi:hypothetical protein
LHGKPNGAWKIIYFLCEIICQLSKGRVVYFNFSAHPLAFAGTEFGEKGEQFLSPYEAQSLDNIHI